MKFKIHGRKVEVTDAIRDYIEEKISKLDKYFDIPEDLEATVVIKIKGKDQIVEITIPAYKMILRAEVDHKDLYAAIDLANDKLERQIRKNKTRLHRKKQIDKTIGFNVDYESNEEVDKTVVKRKIIEMKPMSEEEAILQMELLGHEFFVFQQEKIGSTCILYKRKDGDYGILETN